MGEDRGGEGDSKKKVMAQGDTNEDDTYRTEEEQRFLSSRPPTYLSFTSSVCFDKHPSPGLVFLLVQEFVEQKQH